jgi:hypothetical protein
LETEQKDEQDKHLFHLTFPQFVYSDEVGHCFDVMSASISIRSRPTQSSTTGA